MIAPTRFLPALALAISAALPPARAELSGGPGYVPVDARPGLEPALVAPYQSVPAIYAAGLLRFAETCLASPLPRAGGLCAEARDRAASLAEGHAFDVAANRAAAGFRHKLIDSLRAGFRPDSGLSDPEWLRSLRLVEYLEADEFSAHMAAQPVADTVGDALAARRSDLRARLRVLSPLACLRAPESLPWARRFPGPNEKLVLFLSKAVPDLEAHLRMAVHGAAALQARSLFGAEGFLDAFAAFDYARILDGMRSDSLRSRIWLAKAPAFSHRLKNLLHDAVWVEEMERAPDFGLSGFLVAGSWKLSPADSLRVMDMVRDFGARHAGLAYRIDIHDQATWNDPRYLRLDSLAALEVRRINKVLSPELRAHLDYEPEAELRLLLHARWHGDYLGAFKLHARFKAYARECAAFGDPGADAAAWLSAAVPLLSAADAKRLAAFDGEAWKSLRSRMEADAALLNAVRLALGPGLFEEFRGSNAKLKRMSEGRIRI